MKMLKDRMLSSWAFSPKGSETHIGGKCSLNGILNPLEDQHPDAIKKNQKKFYGCNKFVYFNNYCPEFQKEKLKNRNYKGSKKNGLIVT